MGSVCLWLVVCDPGDCLAGRRSAGRDMAAGELEQGSGDQQSQPEAREEAGSTVVPAHATLPGENAVEAGRAWDPKDKQQSDTEDVNRQTEGVNDVRKQELSHNCAIPSRGLNGARAAPEQSCKPPR